MQNQSNSQNELYTEEAKYADNGVIRENFHATKLQFILFARTYQPVYQSAVANTLVVLIA